MPLNATSAAILNHLNASAPDMKAIGPIEFRAYSAQMVQPADPADRIVTQDVDADDVLVLRIAIDGPEGADRRGRICPVVLERPMAAVGRRKKLQQPLPFGVGRFGAGGCGQRQQEQCRKETSHGGRPTAG